MTTIPAGESTEPRDAADERINLDAWLKAWHAMHPGQSHPLDALGSVEWAETMPVDLETTGGMR